MIYPQFTWWQGVVEDRNDPAKIGRVRVRILGYHTADKSELPTEDLPLAVLMNPVTSASVSGIGQSATGLVEGSHVFGFFADGADSQIPVIMGSLSALSMQPPNENVGFNDPNGVYPFSDNASGRNTVPESDIPRLSREDIAEKHYSLAVKREMKVEGVPIAFAPEIDGDPVKARKTESSWDEPDPQGSAETKTKYPYNHVRETESGHIFEVDDTPGAERIHNFHRTGTFEEIQPDGTKVNKVVGEDYEIVIKDKNMFIKGDFNITVEGDMTLNVKGDFYEDITGNKFSTVRGTRHEKTQGNHVSEIESDYGMNINGNRGVRVGSQGGLGLGGDKLTVLGRRDVMVGQNYNTQVGMKIIQSALMGYNITSELGAYRVFSLRDMDFGTALTGAISFSSGFFNVGTIGATTINTGGIFTTNTIGAHIVNSAAYTQVSAATSITTAALGITAAGVTITSATVACTGAVTATSVVAPVITSGLATLATHRHGVIGGSSAGVPPAGGTTPPVSF